MLRPLATVALIVFGLESAAAGLGSAISEHLHSDRRIDAAGDDEGGRLGLLTRADIAALRQGEALLLLYLSNEGPTFDRPIFDGLHANLDRLGIPRERVIFVSQNRLLRHD